MTVLDVPVTDPTAVTPHPVTIAYLGNFRYLHCSEVAVAGALETLGHTVLRLQEDEVTVSDIDQAAADANLFLFTRTWGCHSPVAMTDLYDHLHASGVVTASYHLDLYVTLPREQTIPGDPFWSTQCVFHPDGSAHTAGVLARYGINHYPLPPAVAASECFEGTRRPEFDFDVVFVGSARPYSHTTEWPFRDLMVNHLADTYGPRFAHYGPGGIRTVRNGLNGDHTQLNDLYATARVVVGDNIHRPGYVSDRLTETLGRGGLLVYPRTDSVAALGYIDGLHYFGYEPGDLHDLERAVTLALAFPTDETDVIRKEAQAVTVAHNTFTHRMQTVLTVTGVTP